MAYGCRGCYQPIYRLFEHYLLKFLGVVVITVGQPLFTQDGNAPIEDNNLDRLYQRQEIRNEVPEEKFHECERTTGKYIHVNEANEGKQIYDEEDSEGKGILARCPEDIKDQFESGHI